MKTKKQSVIESEFQLEVAKVAEKYGSEGYHIYYNYRRKGFVFDLYALNREKGDRIIFEFKHFANYDKGALQIIDQISRYKKSFPDCKVLIVFIRKVSKFKFEEGNLKEYLLRLISEKYERLFTNKISGFQGFEAVTDIEIIGLYLSLEYSSRIEGNGNISFRSSVETKLLSGTLVNDGIPFFFKIESPYFEPIFLEGGKYIDDQRNIVSFDFSEFENLTKNDF